MISYSRIIIFLKIFFFLSSLTILGALFLISPPDNFGNPVDVSTRGIEKSFTYQILDATLRGVTEEGHRFSFKAGSIDPDLNETKNFALNELDGIISLYNKDVFNISARNAFVDTEKKQMELTGNLYINSDSGLSAKSEKILVRFDPFILFSPANVKLETRIGMIDGGSMKILAPNFPDENTTHLYLDKGVKVSIKP